MSSNGANSDQPKGLGRLASKIAIVTGASSGIGRAIAFKFHSEGATVVCADIRPTSRNKSGEAQISTHDAITQDGGKALFVQTDVGSGSDVENMVKRAVEEYGRVDIMVNNAGVAPEAEKPLPVWESDEDAFDLTMRINGKGVYLGCKYASAQMIKQEPGPSGDRGWIVNIVVKVGSCASGALKFCGPSWATCALGNSAEALIVSYVAAKHAAAGITRATALSCAEHRVHCNGICPGYIETSMIGNLLSQPDLKEGIGSLHPWGGGGLGKPEDIAKAAVFLASEDNTWISGALLTVDGAYTAQ